MWFWFMNVFGAFFVVFACRTQTNKLDLKSQVSGSAVFCVKYIGQSIHLDVLHCRTTAKCIVR